MEMVQGSQVSSPGLWSQATRYKPLPGAPLNLPCALSYLGLAAEQGAKDKRAEPGQVLQAPGCPPGSWRPAWADEAIYTSGHHPTKRYIFKRFLPK